MVVGGLHAKFLFVTMFDPSLIASVLNLSDEEIMAVTAGEAPESDAAEVHESQTDALEPNKKPEAAVPAVVAQSTPAAPSAKKPNRPVTTSLIQGKRKKMRRRNSSASTWRFLMI